MKKALIAYLALSGSRKTSEQTRRFVSEFGAACECSSPCRSSLVGSRGARALPTPIDDLMAAAKVTIVDDEISMNVSAAFIARRHRRCHDKIGAEQGAWLVRSE